MKTTTVLLTLLMLITSASFAKSKQPKYTYKVLSTKNHTLHFKVDKSFVGGKAEIYDAQNNLIEIDELPHRHTMIDFADASAGKYTIKVKNGNNTTEFSYTNN